MSFIKFIISVMIVLGLSGQAIATNPPDYIGYFRGNNSNLLNENRSSSNLTNYNSVTWVVGYENTSFALDGVIQYLGLAKDGVFESMFNNGSTWVIEFEIYQRENVSSERYVFAKEYTSHVAPYYQHDIRTNALDIYSYVWSSPYYSLFIPTAYTSISLNTWTKIKIEVNTSAGTNKMWKNDVLVSSQSGKSGTYTNYDTSPYFGGSSNILGDAYNFYGYLDEIYMYNHQIDYTPPNATSLTYTNGSTWVNHTWSSGSGFVTDNYHLTLTNGTLVNTTNPYYNETVGYNNYSNITVVPHNASGSGSLSSGNVTQSVLTPYAVSDEETVINASSCIDICEVNNTEYTNHYEINNTYYKVHINKVTGILEHYKNISGSNDIVLNDTIFLRSGTNWYSNFTLTNIEIRHDTPKYKLFIINGTIGNDTNIIGNLKKVVSFTSSPTIYIEDYFYAVSGNFTLNEYNSRLNFNGGTDYSYGGTADVPAGGSLNGSENGYGSSDLVTTTLSRNWLRQINNSNGSVYMGSINETKYEPMEYFATFWRSDDSGTGTIVPGYYFTYWRHYDPKQIRIWDNASVPKLVLSQTYSGTVDASGYDTSNINVIRNNSRDFYVMSYLISINTSGHTMRDYDSGATDGYSQTLGGLSRRFLLMPGTPLYIGIYGEAIEFEWHTTQYIEGITNSGSTWMSGDSGLANTYRYYYHLINDDKTWFLYNNYNTQKQTPKQAYPNSLDSLGKGLLNNIVTMPTNEQTRLLSNFSSVFELGFRINNLTYQSPYSLSINYNSSGLYVYILNTTTGIRTLYSQSTGTTAGSSPQPRFVFFSNQSDWIDDVEIRNSIGAIIFKEDFNDNSINTSSLTLTGATFNEANGRLYINGTNGQVGSVQFMDGWAGSTINITLSPPNYYNLIVFSSQALFIENSYMTDSRIVDSTTLVTLASYSPIIPYKALDYNYSLDNLWGGIFRNETFIMSPNIGTGNGITQGLFNMHMMAVGFAYEMYDRLKTINASKAQLWLDYYNNSIAGYLYMVDTHGENFGASADNSVSPFKPIRQDGNLEYSRLTGAHDFYEDNTWYMLSKYLRLSPTQSDRFLNYEMWWIKNGRGAAIDTSIPTTATTTWHQVAGALAIVDTRVTQYTGNNSTVSLTVSADNIGLLYTNLESHKSYIRTNQTIININTGLGGIYFPDNHFVLNSSTATFQYTPRLSNVQNIMIYDAWYRNTDNKTKVIIDAVTPPIYTWCKTSNKAQCSPTYTMNIKDGDPFGTWQSGSKYNRTTNHWWDDGNISVIPSSFSFDINSTDTSGYPTMTIDLYNLKNSTKYTINDNGTNIKLLTSNSTGFATYEQELSNHTIVITEGDYFTCGGGLIHYSDSSYNWSICTNVSSTFTISSDKNLTASWSGSATVLFNTTIPEWASQVLYLQHNGIDVDTETANITGFVNFSYTGTNGDFNVSNESLTSSITILANSWGMFNNWSVNTNFSSIAANESNDVTYTYYNTTSGEWDSYYPGYSWNADQTINKNYSVMGFFNAQTTITANTVTPWNTSITEGWNMLYLMGSTNRTLIEIRTNMVNCTDIYYYNSTTNDYVSTGTDTIQPNQGFLAYINQTGTWIRSTI